MRHKTATSFTSSSSGTAPDSGYLDDYNSHFPTSEFQSEADTDLFRMASLGGGSNIINKSNCYPTHVEGSNTHSKPEKLPYVCPVPPLQQQQLEEVAEDGYLVPRTTLSCVAEEELCPEGYLVPRDSLRISVAPRAPDEVMETDMMT